MEIHPIALCYPKLSEAEFAKLKADIQAQGLLIPIVVYEDKVLDGAQRERACRELGIDPRYVTPEIKDPFAYAISLNDRRRHLNKSQLAVIGERLATLRQGSNRYQQKVDLSAERSTPVRSITEVATLLDVGPSTIMKARQIKNIGIPEIVEALSENKIGIETARKIATLHCKADQPAALERAIESCGKNSMRNSPVRNNLAANSKERLEARKRKTHGLSANQIKWQATIDSPSIFPIDAIIPKGEGPEERQVLEAIRTARENEGGIGNFGRNKLQTLIWQNTNCIQGYCENRHNRPRTEGSLDPRLLEWAKDVARKHQARQLIIQEHEIANRANGTNGSQDAPKKPSKKKQTGFEAVFRKFWQKQKPLLRDLRMYGFETFSERWLKEAGAYFAEVGSR